MNSKHAAPRLIKSLEGKHIKDVASTALTTLIITDDLFVYAWTIEKENQLKLVATNESKFYKLACGGSHVLLLNEKGHVYSFGSNKYGQLGTVLTGHNDSVPNNELPNLAAHCLERNHCVQ